MTLKSLYYTLFLIMLYIIQNTGEKFGLFTVSMLFLKNNADVSKKYENRTKFKSIIYSLYLTYSSTLVATCYYKSLYKTNDLIFSLFINILLTLLLSWFMAIIYATLF